MKISVDASELLFRVLFSTIFIGLGGEHLLSDDLIQRLMPAWVIWPRGVSIACGLWLLTWGGMVFLGWKLRYTAFALGIYVILVTAVVHAPGLVMPPPHLPEDCRWLWDILQRSNLAKNLCLLGVCFHLFHHQAGKYSFEQLFRRINSE